MVAQVEGVHNWECETNVLAKRQLLRHGSTSPLEPSSVRGMISSYTANYSSPHSCEISQTVSAAVDDNLQNFQKENFHQLQTSNCIIGQTNLPYYATAFFSTSVMLNIPPSQYRPSPDQNNSVSAPEKQKLVKECDCFSIQRNDLSLRDSIKTSNESLSSFGGTEFYSSNQCQEVTPLYPNGALIMNQSPHERVYGLKSLQTQPPLDSALEINSNIVQNAATISESSAISQKLFPSYADKMPATSSLLRQINNGSNHMNREQQQQLPYEESSTGLDELSTDVHFARSSKIFQTFPSRFADYRFANATNQRGLCRTQTTFYNGSKNKLKHEKIKINTNKPDENFSDDKLTQMSVRDLNRYLRGCRYSITYLNTMNCHSRRRSNIFGDARF